MTSRIPASVIVMTKNEERNIVACLRALSAFKEVFVVDSESDDRTVELAETEGATVVNFSWNGRYPKKKQWSLENLPFTQEWVLYVDADEVMTSALADEIASVLASPDPAAGYFVGYDYVFLGRQLRHGFRAQKLVLFRRGRGRFVDYDDLAAANMWEVEGHYQPVIDGRVANFRHRMVHHDHDSLFHYFERHNRYSDWEVVVRAAGDTAGEERQPALRRLLKKLFARLPAKGLAAFVDSYILRGGLLDGRPGFHFAVARGVYYWQVTAKGYERRITHRDVSAEHASDASRV